MTRKIDLTGKLGIGDRPRIIVDEGVELEVNDSAPTILRVLETIGDNATPEKVDEACTLLFGKKGKAKLDSLGVPLAGYIKVLETAVGLVIGGEGGEDSGNAATPATT